MTQLRFPHSPGIVPALAPLLLLLAGCAAGPAPDGGAAAPDVAAAEGCTLGPDARPGPGGAALWILSCGAEEVGRLSLAPPRAETLPAAIEAAAATQDLTRRAACEAPQPLPLAAGEGQMRLCRLRDGGWPRLALAALGPAGLALAEGDPGAGADLAARAAALAGTAPAAATEDALAAIGAGTATGGSGDRAAFERYVVQGRLANAAENFPAAEAAYRRALEVQTRALGTESPAVGETLITLALEVSNQGRHTEARGLFARAEPLLQRSFDRAALARLAAYRAADAGIAGETEEALRLARDASSRRRELLAEQEPPSGATIGGSLLGNLQLARGELVHALLTEAQAALRAGQPDLARVALEEAAELYRRTRGLPAWWEARLLTLRGQAQTAGGNAAAGIALVEEAVAVQERLAGETWPLASALLDLGRLQAEAGRDGDAVASYTRAFAIIDRVPEEGAPLTFERVAPYVGAAGRLAGSDPGRGPALEAARLEALQRIRGGVVGRTIERASARLAADDPALAEALRAAQVAARERDRLRLELADETAKPDRQRDRAREETLATDLAAAVAASDAADAAIGRDFPDFTRLSRPGPLSAVDVQASLAPDEAVLGFAFGRTGGFGTLVTADSVQVWAIPLGEADLTDRVTRLRRAFVPQDGRVLEYDLREAYDLHQALLGPADAALRGRRHLVFVPAGALASLPPALLVTAPPSPRDYAGAAWLVRDHDLSVSPTLRAFVTQRRTPPRRPAPEPFLGFGDPPFAGVAGPGQAGGAAALEGLATECRGDGGLDPALLRALAPLPETRLELARVAETLGAGPDRVIVGAAASEGAVRTTQLDRYRVLYFATHGLLPGELRCQAEPALAMAPPTDARPDPDTDGLVTASDIAQLSLRADLVVLSACNTAAGGGRFGGEAMAGLAESFFFAGARALLVTHWQVPSEPTVALTTGLFARLQASPGLTSDAALAAAQRDRIAQPGVAHPYFWAAFTLVGDSRSGQVAPQTAAAP